MTARFIDHLQDGTHAARPAATAVSVGTLYSCSDHVLVYQSDGATWANWLNVGTAGISATIMDAKGDLIAGTAADTASRVAVGADYTRLMAKASESAGIKWEGAIGVAVGHSASQSCNNNTETNLTWDTERWDSHAFHDTGTNPSRLTVPAGMGGKYLVFAHLNWAAGDADGFREVRTIKNNTVYLALDTTDVDSTDSHRNSCMTVTVLAAADYVECRGIHTAGAALSVLGDSGTNHITTFGMIFLGP